MQNLFVRHIRFAPGLSDARSAAADNIDVTITVTLVSHVISNFRRL